MHRVTLAVLIAVFWPSIILPILGQAYEVAPSYKLLFNMGKQDGLKWEYSQLTNLHAASGKWSPNTIVVTNILIETSQPSLSATKSNITTFALVETTFYRTSDPSKQFYPRRMKAHVVYLDAYGKPSERVLVIESLSTNTWNGTFLTNSSGIQNSNGWAMQIKTNALRDFVGTLPEWAKEHLYGLSGALDLFPGQPPVNYSRTITETVEISFDPALLLLTWGGYFEAKPLTDILTMFVAPEVIQSLKRRFDGARYGSASYFDRFRDRRFFEAGSQFYPLPSRPGSPYLPPPSAD